MRKTVFLFLLFFPLIELWADSPLQPLVYPNNVVTNNQPRIIWHDIYEKKGTSPIRFRITINSHMGDSSGKIKSKSYILKPRRVYDSFYATTLPKKLAGGKYDMTIEKLHGRHSLQDRRYYYARYPIKSSFSISRESINDLDYLEPRFYIAYNALQRERSFYGYDALFSFVSAMAASGIGFGVYHFFGSSTIGKVLAGVCFLSAGFGYGSSIYYTGQYFSTGNDMDRVLNLGKASNGKVPDARSLRAKFDLKF